MFLSLKQRGARLVTLALTVFSSLPAHSQTPKIFGPGVISTSLDELNTSFCSDGNTVYFSISPTDGHTGMIAHSILVDRNWSKPEIELFNSRYNNYDPCISRDNKKLFFSSDRPIDGHPNGDFNIWYVEKQGGVWGLPQPLSDQINDGFNQFYPTLASNGNLYFNSNKDGSYDLYVSRYVNGKYMPSEKLKGKLNTMTTREGDAIISSDERFMVVTIYGRPDSFGSGDLYISYYLNDEWSEPVNLGDRVNSSSKEYAPAFSADQTKLYFSSYRTTNKSSAFENDNRISAALNGLGNIYEIDFEHLKVRSQEHP